jgi:hypothetical protein
MLSPARVTGEGITSEQHAAVMARYHLAQSLYQYKTVHFTADIEHLDYRRLSVLSVSHDLTQWGFGGRVMAAQRIGAQVQLTLDEPVPWPPPTLACACLARVTTACGPCSRWRPSRMLSPWWASGPRIWISRRRASATLRTTRCGATTSRPRPAIARVTGIDPESDLKGAHHGRARRA